MNKELFCTFDISLELNKLGFNDYCFGYYSLEDFSYEVDKYGILSNINRGDLLSEDRIRYFDCIKENFIFLKAPTLDQAKEWFLTNHNLHIDVISAYSGKFDIDNKLLYYWKPSIEKISIKDDNLFTIDDRMIDLFINVYTGSKYNAYVKVFEKALELIK